MKCPECGAWSLVKETRTSELGYTRRRECANYHRFSTAETVIPEEVVRENHRRAKTENINQGREKKLNDLRKNSYVLRNNRKAA